VRSLAKSLGATVLAVAMVAVLWLFWPTSLGGHTSYLITHGISMEPGFHTGDLAILRAADSYNVGEVAAYHSATLHSVVMHRILSANRAGGFDFKGDNNHWIDPDHPAKSEVVGRLWFRVPGGGKYLNYAHSPWAFAVIGILVISMGSTRTHRRKSGRSARTRTRPWPRTSLLPLIHGTVFGAGAVALLATVAAGVLWTMSPTTATKTTESVTHSPTLTYEGAAVKGTTYPDAQVHTGQAVYLLLVHNLTLDVADKLSSTGRLGAPQTAVGLTVTLATPGWSTVLATSPVKPLNGGKASVSIDLAAAQKRLRSVAAETGAGQVGATVTVAAHLVGGGTTNGRSFNSTVDTTYVFNLDSTALRPVLATVAVGAAGLPSAVGSLSSSVTSDTAIPATVTLRGHRFALSSLRLWVTLVAIGGWLLSALLFPLLHGGRNEVEHAIRIFGTRLVEVTAFAPDQRVVFVPSADALKQVADRYERLILHLCTDYGDVFAVQEDGISYQLRMGGTEPPRQHLSVA
jgi:signal peptidase I